MSSAAASLADIRRLSPRRELLLGAALTAAFAALVLAVGPAPGDAPVHLYRPCTGPVASHGQTLATAEARLRRHGRLVVK